MHTNHSTLRKRLGINRSCSECSEMENQGMVKEAEPGQSNNTVEKASKETFLPHDEPVTITTIQPPGSGDMSAYQIIIFSCKRFQYKLYLTLLFSQLIPTLYKSVRIFYLGQLPNTYGVDIASQLMWVSLILEIFQEALILPLYHEFGTTLQDQTQTKNKLKIGIIVTFLVHFVLAGVLIASAWPLLKIMAQKQENLEKTVVYIRLELLDIPLSSVNAFFVTALTVLCKNKHLYIILLLRMCCTIATDTCFLSKAGFSMQLGVNGIAYGNILSTGIIFIYCAIVCCRDLEFTPQDIFLRSNYDFSWMRSWYRVGFFSGLDSLIRNVFYILCVLRMMNVVKEQGLYWRGNEFIWNWLLLLYIPLSNVLKQDACNEANLMNHKHKLTVYFIGISGILFLWLASIPAWKYFFAYAMQVKGSDVDHMFNLVLILVPFYFFYMVTTLLNSVFYGKGKTIYLAIKSCIPNLCINLTAFLLFLSDIYKPNVTSIALLFGSTMALGECCTIMFYFYYLKTVGYKI